MFSDPREMYVGQEVVVRFDDDQEFKTKVTHVPTKQGGPNGYWVAWLDGVSGCYLMSRVRMALPGEVIPHISVRNIQRKIVSLRTLLDETVRWRGNNPEIEAADPELWAAAEAVVSRLLARIALLSKQVAS